MISATGYFTTVIVVSIMYLCWAAGELERHVAAEKASDRRIRRLEAELETANRLLDVARADIAGLRSGASR